MEDFEKIKKISLKEAKEMLPQNIAYLTLKNGEIIIVNGLDHNKFNQREREYENYIEEISKSKSPEKIKENPLQKIQEDAEENERNSLLFNQDNQEQNSNKNIKINLNQKYYKDYLDNNKKGEKLPFPHQNENNSFHRFNDQYNKSYMPNNNNYNNFQNQNYNNSNNHIKYINQIPQQINYGNPENRGNYIDSDQFQNNYSQYYRPNINNIQYEQGIRPNSNRRRLFGQYKEYNNHGFSLIKQTKKINNK